MSDINWFETVNNNEMEIEFSNEMKTLQIKKLSSDVLLVSKESVNSNVNCTTNVICPPTILFTNPVKSKNLDSVGISIPLSQPFMLETEKMNDNELNENASLNNKVEKTITLLNKNLNINVEIDSKEISSINDSIAKNKDSREDDMEIDVIVEDNELNENVNNNKVENNELVKDKFQES